MYWGIIWSVLAAIGILFLTMATVGLVAFALVARRLKKTRFPGMSSCMSMMSRCFSHQETQPISQGQSRI